MPGIPTLISDIENGLIVGLGARPDDNNPSNQSDLSVTRGITFLTNDVKISLSPTNRLTATMARGLDVNAAYLHYRVETSTVTAMSMWQPYVVSGNYSGCQWRVYRTDGGMLRCVHTARPGTNNPTAYLDLLDDYAHSHNWTLLQDIPTVGLIAGNVAGVAFVSHMSGGNLNTVRWELNALGGHVNATRFTDPL